MPYVYAFDHKHRRPPMELKDLLGGKGANLAEMISVLKLPVPHGFTFRLMPAAHTCTVDGQRASISRSRIRLQLSSAR